VACSPWSGHLPSSRRCLAATGAPEYRARRGQRAVAVDDPPVAADPARPQLRPAGARPRLCPGLRVDQAGRAGSLRRCHMVPATADRIGGPAGRVRQSRRAQRQGGRVHGSRAIGPVDAHVHRGRQQGPGAQHGRREGRARPSPCAGTAHSHRDAPRQPRQPTPSGRRSSPSWQSSPTAVSRWTSRRTSWGCVASPSPYPPDGRGGSRLAVSMSGPISRVTDTLVTRAVPLLTCAATTISEEVGRDAR
jgi:hypothetical protein